MILGRRSLIPWLGAAVLAVSLWSSSGAAQPSAADLETARALYKEGKTLRDAGKIPEARDKFKAAHSVGQTPITGIELARTHVTLGEIVEAREVCLGIARLPVASDETERSAAARSEAAQLAEQLKPRIPALLIRLPAVQGPAPEVAVDGRVIPPAALGEPRKVNPGAHEVVVTFADGTQSKVPVQVKESETKEVLVPRPPPGAPVVAPPRTGPNPNPYGPVPRQPEPEKKGLPGYAYAGFAVAAGGILVGSVTGLMALSRKSELESNCPNHKCNRDQWSDLDDAKALGNASSTAWGVGFVGLVVGMTGVLLSNRSSKSETARVSPWVGPRSLGLEGAF